jgi:hypothetical protein
MSLSLMGAYSTRIRICPGLGSSGSAISASRRLSSGSPYFLNCIACISLFLSHFPFSLFAQSLPSSLFNSDWICRFVRPVPPVLQCAMCGMPAVSFISCSRDGFRRIYPLLPFVPMTNTERLAMTFYFELTQRSRCASQLPVVGFRQAAKLLTDLYDRAREPLLQVQAHICVSWAPPLPQELFPSGIRPSVGLEAPCRRLARRGRPLL